MTRQRAFCRYCGRMIRPMAHTPEALHACLEHKPLLAEDWRYAGAVLDPPRSSDLRFRAMQAAPPSEDVQATEGMEA